MTSSGLYRFNPTVSELVTASLRLIGAHATGETPGPSEISEGIEALNYMLLDWHNDGIGLWLNQEITLFQELNKKIYNLGPSGDHASPESQKTEIATAASSDATSIVVDSVSGIGDTFDPDGIIEYVKPTSAGAITMDGALVSGTTATMPSVRKIVLSGTLDESARTFTIVGTDALGDGITETIDGIATTSGVFSVNEYKTVTSISVDAATAGNVRFGVAGDFIGIELDDGTLQWTNIRTSPLTTTMSIVGTLTDDVAVDNHVYTYSEKTQRPYEIIEFRRIGEAGNEIPVEIMSRESYMALNDKDSAGVINQVYYDPQLTNGQLRIWQVSDNVKNTAKMTIKYPFEIYDASTDTSNLPPNAFKALKYNLAIELAPEYEEDPSPYVFATARDTKERLVGFDMEDTSVFISVGGYY